MAKGKDDFWTWVLLISGAVIGGAAIAELLRKRYPCPRCNRLIDEYQEKCKNCGVLLAWEKKR